MENKIQEILKLFENEDKAKIEDMLKILTDMKLGEDKHLEAVLYQALLLSKTSLEEIKENYDEKIYATIEILNKLDKINYSQQSTEA